MDRLELALGGPGVLDGVSVDDEGVDIAGCLGINHPRRQ